MMTDEERRREGLILQHRREMAGLSVATAADLLDVPEDDVLAGERDLYRLSDAEVELLRAVYQRVVLKRQEERRLQLEVHGTI